MRHLALTLSIIGAILISAGAVCFFISTVATAGIYALYVFGSIGLALGLIIFVINLISEKNSPHHRV